MRTMGWLGIAMLFTMLGCGVTTQKPVGSAEVTSATVAPREAREPHVHRHH